MCMYNHEWSSIYHYFTTYRNNVIEVEQDPSKGEEQVHVFLYEMMEWLKIVSRPEDVYYMRLC
jgi:hypothetical protein